MPRLLFEKTSGRNPTSTKLGQILPEGFVGKTQFYLEHPKYIRRGAAGRLTTTLGKINQTFRFGNSAHGFYEVAE